MDIVSMCENYLKFATFIETRCRDISINIDTNIVTMSMLLNLDMKNNMIFIGDKVFTDLGNFINSGKYAGSKFFILVDENTSMYCLPVLLNGVCRDVALQRLYILKAAEIIELKSGEQNKNIDTCLQIWERLSVSGADRKSLLINLGGGVITDIGGFAGSTYKRGIDFINVPTTLLSQVDASVGGKTGVNLKNIKNQLGVFNNPKAVFIYPGFLETLDKRHLLSGFAEVIKHGLINSADYWKEITSENLLELSPDSKKWVSVITRSIAIKNEIVIQDPVEDGIRKALNFGHTIGHALETYSLENDANPLLHGEAVAAGMICEAYLSCKTVGLSRVELNEITSFILSKYKPYRLAANSYKNLVELMKHDKKNQREQINFTLLSQIGKPVLNKSCSIELIEEALEFYREKCQPIKYQRQARN